MGRTIALLIAVAAGIGLTLATIGVSQSAQAQVATTFDLQLNRYVTIGWPPGTDLRPAVAEPQIVERVQRIPGVESTGVLFDFEEHRLQVAQGRAAFTVGTLAGSPGVLGAADLSINWSPGGQHPAQVGEALIGQSLADQLNLGTLDSSPTVILDGRSVSVAGIITDSPRLPNLLGQAILSLEEHRGSATP